ncbi:MAG TPA: hypothetical protein VGO43_00530 [Pyrinomonadaceae bacterium]|jgi:hypothetical protein|nr:hypothetical protein [Pyrinomonadaceae bacterium]
MITRRLGTLTEKTAEIEEATVALFSDRCDLAGDGARCESVRDGVAALIAAGPPATLFVRARFDWGEPEKYFDAREGDVEDAHVKEILEYFSVQLARNK